MIVGHTLVDASSWSASVLMVNPDADEIVLPCFTCVGNLVPVSSVSVALAEPVPPGEMCETLPDHLEDIVTGSHPSLGEADRHPTSDARPVRCGPHRLAPAVLRTEQTWKCWREDRLSPAIVHGRPSGPSD